MDYKLIHASLKDKDVIKNLMQLYTYDFSEYTDADVEENGFFAAYPQLENYWKDTMLRFPYLIMKEEKYIGFVLVKFIQTEERNYFSIAEFFVMKKYRRQGIGNALAKKVFTLHKGKWEVFQMKANVPAQAFWRNVIAEYTDGKFTEQTAAERLTLCFEN